MVEVLLWLVATILLGLRAEVAEYNQRYNWSLVWNFATIIASAVGIYTLFTI